MTRIPQAEFDRALAELSKQPKFYMSWPVHSFDPEQAARRRYYPLAQVIYWLEKQPRSWANFFADMELLSLAKLHIKTGYLKHYGPSTRFDFDKSSETEECIVDGELMIVEVMRPFAAKEIEDAQNPLVDIFEFADWFRGLRFDYLSLPGNWPTTEPSQANMPAPESGQPERTEPAEGFRFNAPYETVYAEPLKALAERLFRKHGKNATAIQAWNELKEWFPHGHLVEWDAGKTFVSVDESDPIDFEQFKRKWNRYTKPAK